MWSWCGGGYGGMFMGPLSAILVLALVIAAIVFLVQWSTKSQRQTALPTARTPLDILKERFAKGEINKDEYEENRRILG